MNRILHGARDHAPYGYRFLIQLVDAETEEEARKTILRMFHSRHKEIKMIRGHFAHYIFYKDRGFMVFVPGREVFFNNHYEVVAH